MKVIVAKTAGFCFGVKRAVDQVYRQIEEGKKPIYTYGPIIHNEEVVRELAEKGVQIVETEEELRKLKEGTVIIRSHGVPERIYRLIEAQGLEMVDATCPFVKKIHRIVQNHSAEGREIVIIGNDGHPEVEGIKGWCSTKVTVIGEEAEAEAFLSVSCVCSRPADGTARRRAPICTRTRTRTRTHSPGLDLTATQRTRSVHPRLLPLCRAQNPARPVYSHRYLEYVHSYIVQLRSRLVASAQGRYPALSH